MPIKKVKKSRSRQYHRFFGGISFLFLSVIVGSGLVLMNPHWVGSDLTITTALQQSKGTWVGTQSGLYYQKKNTHKKNTELLQRVPLRYPSSKVVGIIDRPHLMVAFQEALLLEKKGTVWQRIPLPPEVDELWALTSSKMASRQGVLLTTNNGVYLYQNETWIQQFQAPESQLLYWVKKLHTGYIGADWVRSVFEALSWVTMGLIVTGVVLLFRP